MTRKAQSGAPRRVERRDLYLAKRPLWDGLDQFTTLERDANRKTWEGAVSPVLDHLAAKGAIVRDQLTLRFEVLSDECELVSGGTVTLFPTLHKGRAIQSERRFCSA